MLGAGFHHGSTGSPMSVARQGWRTVWRHWRIWRRLRFHQRHILSIHDYRRAQARGAAIRGVQRPAGTRYSLRFPGRLHTNCGNSGHCPGPRPIRPCAVDAHNSSIRGSGHQHAGARVDALRARNRRRCGAGSPLRMAVLSMLLGSIALGFLAGIGKIRDQAGINLVGASLGWHRAGP